MAKKRDYEKIEVGEYVRITTDFPPNRMLQNQTGSIVALPNKEHPDEYLVKLDSWINLSPHHLVILVRVPAGSLELANSIRCI